MTGTVNIDRIPYHNANGKIVYFDDFDEISTYTVTGWQAVTGGTGTTAIGTDWAYGGSVKSLKFTTQATAAQYQGAKIQLGEQNSANQAYGVYFVWYTEDTALANFQDFYIEIDYYDETYKKTAKIKHRGTDTTTRNDWQYWKSDGTYSGIDDADKVSSASQKLVDGNKRMHYCKLTVDFANTKYLWLYSDGHKHDLRDLSCQSAADTGAPGIDISVVVSTETGTAINFWIDNFLVTVFEDR